MSDTLHLDALTGSIRGQVMRPDDVGFDAARQVWNGMVDRRPAAIVRCRGTADVVAAVDAARDQGLGITVRGGGHGVAGNAVRDGALLLDLSEMDDIHVDPRARTARVGPGARWGQVDHETQAFGLATTGGVDSRTGVAGLTLGGGVGYLARSCGLAVDNLRTAEVVLADGRVVTADEHEHADLLWGLRGGGGNLGVVTSFELQLHDVGPQVMTAQVFLPMQDAAAGLDAYRGFMASAPDEVACYALFVNVPPVEPFPEAQHGRTALALVACHAGSLEGADEILAPLTRVGTPMLAVVAPMPYTDLQRSFDAGAPDGGRYYWKSSYLDDLTDELIDVLVGSVDPLPGPYSNVFLEPMGGAVARVAADATAFPHRAPRFNLGISTGWVDAADDDTAIGWTRDLHAAIEPHARDAVYLNYLDRDDAGRLEAAFGPNLQRLREVKAIYDPHDLFHVHDL